MAEKRLQYIVPSHRCSSLSFAAVCCELCGICSASWYFYGLPLRYLVHVLVFAPISSVVLLGIKGTGERFMGPTRPPLDYLATCSQMSLEGVELSRLNRAANLRKEFEEILDEWIDSEVDARLARTILEWRRRQDVPSSASALQASAQVPQWEQLAIAFPPGYRALPAGDAPGRDEQSAPDEIPPNRETDPVTAPLRPRSHKRVGAHAALRANAAPAHRGDENSPVAGKNSRPNGAAPPRSALLAKAAAVNLGAARNLVAPPSGKPPPYRTIADQTNSARKAARKNPAAILAARKVPRTVHAQPDYSAQDFRARRAG
jgi:hypothetical protein